MKIEASLCSKIYRARKPFEPCKVFYLSDLALLEIKSCAGTKIKETSQIIKFPWMKIQIDGWACVVRGDEHYYHDIGADNEFCRHQCNEEMFLLPALAAMLKKIILRKFVDGPHVKLEKFFVSTDEKDFFCQHQCNAKNKLSTPISWLNFHGWPSEFDGWACALHGYSIEFCSRSLATLEVNGCLHKIICKVGIQVLLHLLSWLLISWFLKVLFASQGREQDLSIFYKRNL